MSRPTFYRALKELVEKGFLTAASSGRDGRYRIKC
jgi:DNA-binding IclR family transcriptional regulator